MPVACLPAQQLMPQFMYSCAPAMGRMWPAKLLCNACSYLLVCEFPIWSYIIGMHPVCSKTQMNSYIWPLQLQTAC